MLITDDHETVSDPLFTHVWKLNRNTLTHRREYEYDLHRSK